MKQVCDHARCYIRVKQVRCPNAWSFTRERQKEENSIGAPKKVHETNIVDVYEYV
jgi:hypothetical protein